MILNSSEASYISQHYLISFTIGYSWVHGQYDWLKYLHHVEWQQLSCQCWCVFQLLLQPSRTGLKCLMMVNLFTDGVCHVMTWWWQTRVFFWSVCGLTLSCKSRVECQNYSTVTLLTTTTTWTSSSTTVCQVAILLNSQLSALAALPVL